MSKFTFICDDGFDGRKITYEVNSINLHSVVEEFGNFLRGCGYVFDGELDIVQDEGIKLNYDTPNVNYENNISSFNFSDIVDAPGGGVDIYDDLLDLREDYEEDSSDKKA